MAAVIVSDDRLRPDALPRGSLSLRPGEGLEAATARLLTEGGDARIGVGPGGVNAYGCSPWPDAGLVPLGSSTASSPSEAGFRAALALHARLRASPARIDDELQRLRRDLLRLSGAEQVPGTELVLAASGTDLHLIVAHLLAAVGPLQAVMADPGETGRGVAAALAGCHFGDCTSAGTAVPAGVPLATGASIAAPVGVRLRDDDGRPRPVAEVDADYVREVERVLAAGSRCLLVLTDLSKTGLLAPSPGCAAQLQRRHGEQVTVLVDACQFRLAPASLVAYLRQGFLVAVTGSKFVTGPAFCGGLLLPPAAVPALRRRPLAALRAYSTRADWPPGWAMATELPMGPNVGLMLRWAAALAELARLRAVPDAQVTLFLQRWRDVVMQRLAREACLEALTVPSPVRGDPEGGEAAVAWDACPTILPFLILRPGPGGRAQAFDMDEAACLHRRLQQIDCSLPALMAAQPADWLRVQLGQPVAAARRDGRTLGALRLCASARLVAQAAESPQAAERVIAQTLAAIDKLVQLVRSWPCGD
jgi:hypothetical protein